MKRSDLELLGIAAALLAAALFVSSCKTTSSSESHMAASAAETLNATAHTETHVEEAPSKVTTTVEEFAVGLDGRGDSPALANAGLTRPPNPTLVKRTVTVEERGAVTTASFTDAKSQERADTEINTESESKSTKDFLHNPFALLGGLVALAGVAFAAWKVFKPRILP